MAIYSHPYVHKREILLTHKEKGGELRVKIVKAFNECETRTKYTKNEIRVMDSGICEIDVYNPHGVYKETGTFSVEDLDVIIKHKWYSDNAGYLSTTVDGKKVRMHRMLFPDKLTDHIDGNKLNNTRNNLQQISQSENIARIKNKMQNPSGVTGVHKTKCNTWHVAIETNKIKKQKNFKKFEDAVLIRYIWEINAWKHNAPQIDIIKEAYPALYRSADHEMVKVSENLEAVKAGMKLLDGDVCCAVGAKNEADEKCMCSEFLSQIRRKEEGYCKCGLYYYGAER